MKIRNLKQSEAVSGSCRIYTIQAHVSPSGDGKPLKIRPMVNLCGDWLADAGFLPGDKMIITVQPGGLNLRVGTTSEY